MKKCPSCSAECETAAELCPVCGYTFDAGDQPKRTIMGFPSLAAALQDAEDEEPEEPAKQTLFGFPAQKAFSGDESSVVADHGEDDGEGATSIIPASALSFAGDVLSDSDDDDDAFPTMEKELRGTVAGRPLKPRPEFTDDATEIVSGTAVFPGIRPVVGDDDGEDIRAKGTLMGMSLADAQARAPQPQGRSTQFAIPAVQAEQIAQHTARGNRGIGEESEGQLDDSPTEAWSPAALNKIGDTDGRKKLLDKIRKSRPLVDEDIAAASASIDGSGPDLSTLKNLKPKRDPHLTPTEFPSPDERDTNENPSAARPTAPEAGVVRSARTKRLSDTGSARPPIGASGYSLGPGEAQSDQSLDAISDPEFGLMETDIASGEVLQQAVQNLADAGFGLDAGQQDRPAPLQTQRKGIYHDAFDGGSGEYPPSLDADDEDSVSKTVPTEIPAYLQTGERPPLQPQQPQPYSQPQPPQFQQPSRPLQPPHQTPQPFPQPAPPRPLSQPIPMQQPFQPQPQPQPSAQNIAPYVPPPNTGVHDQGDPLVRYIQGAFGIAAGAIAIIVQLFVWVTSDLQGIKPVAVTAFGGVLGLVAIVAAVYPLPSKLRSWAFYGVAVLLFVCTILGAIAGLPSTFYVIALGALLAAVTGAFPMFARFVS